RCVDVLAALAFDQGAGFLSGLSLVVGIALARVLRTYGAKETMLKWPNDLLWRHLKIAGILIELAGDVMGPTTAIIGIGLNLRLPESVKERIDQPVTDIVRIGIESDRNVLFAQILGELDRVLSQFSTEGFAPFRDEWDRLHVYRDKMVRVRMPDSSEIEGRVHNIGDDGALLLQTRSGLRKFYGGELSLRGVA
ncbi:MAG: biotin--[acetyl-CoA-carboxylase] ligase, partial [Betaproteobacteria bacterium]